MNRRLTELTYGDRRGARRDNGGVTEAPRQARRPTLAAIAAEAGVSKSLVSLALRGEAGVGEDTRRLILAVARALGREPSAHALGVLDGPRLVGVIATDLSNPFHVDVLRGVNESAERHGFRAVIADGARDVDRMVRDLEMFSHTDTAGIVVSSSWLPAAAIAAAGRLRPVVVVGTSVVAVPGTDTVRGDLKVGIRKTVEHLVAAGHRRIGFIAESHRSSSLRRHAAYLEEMTQFQLRDSTISAHIEDLQQRPDRLVELVRSRGFTAFIAANDLTAISLIELAAGTGLQIPGDMAVAGYDDTSPSRIVRPQLTTVEQPWTRMGARAFELLRERAIGRDVDRHEVTVPTLVVRTSTAIAS